MKEILRTKCLGIGYEKEIVGNIDISVNAGEIVVVIGPNGAGKTTLLKTICGIIPSLSGDIFVENKNITEVKLNDRAKVIASVLTEKIYAEYSCEEMVAMGRYPYTNGIGTLSGNDKDIVLDAMKQTDILSFANKSFLKISDGQKQRVLLARAICQRPKLLVLDEPTSFLDVKYKMEFLSLLRDLSSQMNFSVIMSLHELDMAKQIADRIICIKKDKVDRIASPDEIFMDGYIKELFDIKTGDFDEQTGLGVLWHTN